MTFDDYLNKQLKNDDFKKEYEALEDEYSIAEQFIKARIQKNLTQKQLAELSGTRQSAIARLESGNYNPSVKFLQKVADVLGKKISVVLL